jgi:predicted TIM-barrel fold metal-dependent hydrolase
VTKLPSTSEQRVIDVDFVAAAATMPQLLPHLSEGWREHLSVGGGLSAAATRAQVGYVLPAPPYRLPPRAGGEGALERARDWLDEAEVEVAVLDAGIAGAVSGLANVVMAAEIARAANEWLVKEWLGADERFRGSILVAPRDAAAAAAEVRRLAADARFVQVVVAFPPALLGDRALHPLFEAAEEAGLPLCFQAGGAFAGSNPGPTPTGFPTSTAEYRIDSAYAGVAHLVSLVLEGVCERFPSLRVVFSGFGIGWLPSALWRLERAFDGGSAEAAKKGLRRRPSEVVRAHVRFTTRDLDAPSVAELERVLPVEDVELLLLYASGYPESDGTFDWEALPERARNAILHDNAAAWLRLSGVETAAGR